MKLIAFTLCLLPFASAVYTTLFWCDTTGAYSDPLMLTQQARPLEINELQLVAMHSSTEQDHNLKCSRMSLLYGEINKALILTTFNQDGASVTYLGNVTAQNANFYMQVAPLSDDVLGSLGAENFPNGVFDTNSNGVRLFVAYLSSTEVILRTCRNSFFGSSHSAYLFSSQADLITSLDPACMKSAISGIPHMDTLDMEFKSYDEVMACEKEEIIDIIPQPSSRKQHF